MNTAGDFAIVVCAFCLTLGLVGLAADVAEQWWTHRRMR